MTRRRLLYVGQFDIPKLMRDADAGVAPSNHLHAMNGLAAQGFEVRSLALTTAEMDSVPAFQRRVLASLDGIDALVAHSHYAVRKLGLMRLGRLLRPALLSFVHIMVPRPWDRLWLRGFDALLPLSRCAEQHLQAAGYPADRTHYFPYGADLGFYRPLPWPEVPASGDTPIVLSVGVSGRDFATLISAAPSIRAEVHIVGPVDAADRARAAANVVVHGSGDYGLSFDALRALYARARAVAVIHHGEAQPYGLNSVVEAMGYGRPVVMSAGPGIDIDPGADGFGARVPVHDAGALATAINGLLARPDLPALGARARDAAERQFNTTVMAAVIERALRGLDA